MACLSSRIPWGEPVTEEKLKMIEQAENFIRDLGFHDVRVRHHELHSNAKSLDRCIVKSEGSDSTIQRFNAVTSLARIEVGIAELPRLLAGENFLRVGEALKKIDRKSTRLNSSHLVISYAVFCLKKKKSTYDGAS